MSMVEKRWTGQSAKSAASNVGGRLRQGAAQTLSAAKDVGAAVGQAAAVVPDLVTGIEGPTFPLHSEWGIGLGQILGSHPAFPGGLRGVALNLDRLGGLRISPHAINIDGETVPWEKISEITFGPVLDVVTSRALQREVARLTGLLPPVPGRKWLVRQAVEILVSLCFAAGGAVSDPDPGTHDSDPAVAPDLGVPMVFRYRGMARQKELTPGMFVVLAASAIPAVSDVIALIARQRGITITVAPPSRSRRNAAAMREMAASLASHLRHTDDSHMTDGGDGPQPAAPDSSATEIADTAPGAALPIARAHETDTARGKTMAIFGKSKAERQAEAQRVTAGRNALDDVQSAFSSTFKTWAAAIAQARSETGAQVLTDEILQHVGPMPSVHSTILTDIQRHYIRSYAYSYSQNILDYHKNTSIIAADQAEQGGATGQVDAALSYWASIDAYVADTIG
jgi:hypothetical protein